jgi:hypothetical protein
MPPTGLAHKGDAVEEWIDIHFFRPVGLRVIRVLEPTRISADQVTVASLLVGLLAGHLFLYRSPVVNAAGLALFIASDILDSADGQLARSRGSSTRFGRILDGISDNARFVNLYAHLLVRLLLAHAMAPFGAVALTLAAGVSHSLQAGVADFIRQVYLYVAEGSGELDLPEDLLSRATTPLANLGLWIYRSYVTRQARWCARSTALVRTLRRNGGIEGMAREWAERQAGTVRHGALIAQNVRFLLLAVTACLGWPAGFLWLTLGPLNLALIWVLWSHERIATRLGRLAEPSSELLPVNSL